ncbi:MAG: preprotein translocase subunit SecG [Halobacteriovorax sp.]|nr:preprotein translocase subunit SecG [Halobacteriovorax sp.]|tara:strand:- start:7010 stop:7375 length:366 start_codon:yes stop_codon:yes gene_type:complete
MVTTLMVFHVVISVLLILLVLLQFGKGAEAGLMGGSSGEVFTASQQGNILSKITVVLAVLFLGNSVFLAKIQSTKSSSSLLDSEAPIARPLNNDAAAAPAVPATEAPKAEAKPTEAPAETK